ncbi:substrate-binding periplasmic protein [Colwelliaceae bacterium 6471]
MSRLLLSCGLYFLLILSVNAFQDNNNQYDVSYRDYLGLHVVKGQKTPKGTFLFNANAEKKLTLATLNWQPYIGESICKQGWVMQLTVALLHSIGYSAEVTFYPWARAVNMVESGKADILFPEYFIEPEAPSDVFAGTRRLDHLMLSDVFGWGPIAFIKRRDFDMSHYTDLKSLVNEHIGVVRGYQNTPEFDRLMDTGSFKTVKATNDMQNLDLLLNNRVNLIIGDPEVIKADIINSDHTPEDKKAMLEKIKMVDPIIHMNGLFYAVSKQSEYKNELIVELNQAINTFKSQGVIDEIKYQTKQACNSELSE